MIGSLHLSFENGVSIVETDDGTIVLELVPSRLRLANLSPGVKAALKLLVSPTASESELYDVAKEVDNDLTSGCRLIYYLRQLREAGLLQYSLKRGPKLVATIHCFDGRPLLPLAIPEGGRMVLSRFSYLCGRDGEAVLESPLARARIVIKEAACFEVLFRLMRPQTSEELFADLRAGLQVEIREFIEVLYYLSMVRNVEHEEGDDCRYWEFHDLVFHARTRLWRRDNPTGATFRSGLETAPVPALKPPMSTQSFRLYTPDIGWLTRNDRPFTEVLESRRSVRDSSTQVISADQVGEFLYRFARISSAPGLAGTEADTAATARLYPNGGSCYELEIYILIARCKDIAHGLYHYRPDSHELSTISTENSHLEQIVQEVKWAAPGSTPQVIVILTARFARIFWKYEGIAYSLILQNVGVLFQTMYLVATAMRLKPCAIGAMNSQLFARATGIDTLAEASVGEFILNGST
jgi:SagB-type dehydrogenase family enzyme